MLPGEEGPDSRLALPTQDQLQTVRPPGTRPARGPDWWQRRGGAPVSGGGSARQSWLTTPPRATASSTCGHLLDATPLAHPSHVILLTPHLWVGADLRQEPGRGSQGRTEPRPGPSSPPFRAQVWTSLRGAAPRGQKANMPPGETTELAVPASEASQGSGGGSQRKCRVTPAPKSSSNPAPLLGTPARLPKHHTPPPPQAGQQMETGATQRPPPTPGCRFQLPPPQHWIEDSDFA